MMTNYDIAVYLSGLLGFSTGLVFWLWIMRDR